MKTLAPIARQKINGWNQHRLNEADAYRFCRENHIYVVTDAREKAGKLIYYKGYTFILLSPTLDDAMRLWVIWHEIAHFILHYPATSRFSSSMKRKNDREANCVAAVAIMPRSAIEGQTVEQVAHDLNVPIELVRIRKLIAENEGV